ncbi:hypothetical protein HJFPF1_07275 [Paramyrothecium foliicola]|nr:hypothetical protein HJFPF1_07275 [Paramyrothecium foliicola]
MQSAPIKTASLHFIQPSKPPVPQSTLEDAAVITSPKLAKAQLPSPYGYLLLSHNPLFADQESMVNPRLSLHLFHHYITMTSYLPDHRKSWGLWIVDEAVKSPSVMDALLGLSAFHLRRRGFTNKALGEASHALMAPGLDKVLCEASQATQDSQFDFLLEYKDRKGPFDKASWAAYRRAVAVLSWLNRNLEEAKPLFFFIAVPPHFVQLLVDKDSRALAILGYFYMVVKKARGIWWFDGAAEQEFAVIMACLPERWLPAMSLALQYFVRSDPESIEKAPATTSISKKIGTS